MGNIDSLKGNGPAAMGRIRLFRRKGLSREGGEDEDIASKLSAWGIHILWQ